MLAAIVEQVEQAQAGGTMTPWHWWAIGFGGQVVFGSRFYVQWLTSEKHKRSVVPDVFWWLSLAGGLLTLAYSLYRWDPVFIAANVGGPPIYARNLWLIRRAARAQAALPKTLD
ncbi:MAG TPA: lipid-A-disaccharide synthase N-terminal domain-containing protein [Planctomycetota bacterium]|nr:lipid-A-disaccharide synthase N-terminal domain-containing protein [Planctomycetota bacterium]